MDSGNNLCLMIDKKNNFLRKSQSGPAIMCVNCINVFKKTESGVYSRPLPLHGFWC